MSCRRNYFWQDQSVDIRPQYKELSENIRERIVWNSFRCKLDGVRYM